MRYYCNMNRIAISVALLTSFAFILGGCAQDDATATTEPAAAVTESNGDALTAPGDTNIDLNELAGVYTVEFDPDELYDQMLGFGLSAEDAQRGVEQAAQMLGAMRLTINADGSFEKIWPHGDHTHEDRGTVKLEGMQVTFPIADHHGEGDIEFPSFIFDPQNDTLTEIAEVGDPMVFRKTG